MNLSLHPSFLNRHIQTALMVNISEVTVWKWQTASNQNPCLISNHDQITFHFANLLWNDFGLNTIKRYNSKSNIPKNYVDHKPPKLSCHNVKPYQQWSITSAALLWVLCSCRSNENHAISDSFGFGFSQTSAIKQKNQDIDKKILSFRLKRWLIQSKKTKSLFQDELIQLSAEERALGSDYELEKALGSK